MIVTAGKTDVTVYFYIVQDASNTSPGEPVTGLVFSDIETGGSASYCRAGAARTDLTLVTLASASAAHADGGFIEVDATNMPGVYRCDYPDAAFSTGVDQVILSIVVASSNNAVAAPIYVDITDVDLRDSVRGGMSALPNAAADGAGGLPVSDAGGLDLDALNTSINNIETDTNELQSDWTNGGRLDLILDEITTNVDAVETDTQNIQSRLPAVLVSGLMQSNVASISESAGAADNLELMYDGTGYVDDTAPASRAQVNNISSSSGGAVNFSASEDNQGGAIDPSSATFVGSNVSGNYTNLQSEDGSVFSMEDIGNDIDLVLGFYITGSRVATSCNIVANVDGNADEMVIQAYDHVGAAWETLGTIAGTGGTANVSLEVPLFQKHTGTVGAEIGKVYIRFETLSTTPSLLSIDQCIVSAVLSGTSIGYEQGAVWVDTNVSNTNTESFVDGVASNPVSTVAAARTIADNLNTKHIRFLPGSSVTLAQSYDNFEFSGENYTIALGGQSISNAYLSGAVISGTFTATSNPILGVNPEKTLLYEPVLHLYHDLIL